MTERTPAIAHPTGAPLRSSNLFSVALTTIALGALAAFDIIPGWVSSEEAHALAVDRMFAAARGGAAGQPKT